MSKAATHWILAMALTVGACSAGPGASGGPSAATFDPVASIDLRSDEPPATLDPATAAAQAFRLQYGLRADLEWIELVAADPAANQGIIEWGVPLTPEELAELQSRHNPLERTITELHTDIRAYGALFPESFADAYLDQRVAVGFVVLFSRDVDRHRAALRALFPPVVELDVREVRWSLRELDAFTERVNNDRDWLGPDRAQFWGAETSSIENRVYLNYYGRVDLAAEIAAHYGNPPWLIVERDGPLPWTGPRGELIIDVVKADGSPVLDVQCDAIADDPEAREGSALSFGTDTTGRCLMAGLPVGSYEVVFERRLDNGLYERVHAVRLVLSSPGTSIRVVLPSK